MKTGTLTATHRIRRLDIGDAQAIFQLYAGNPQYFAAMQDQPSLQGAMDDLSALPAGKAQEDKHFLGFYEGDQLAAVMDLILGYPDEKTALIGLFMMDAGRQGRGEGSVIISKTLKTLSSQGFTACRLACVQTNQQSRHFWQKNGFYETGERSERDGYTLIVMRKDI